MSLFLFEFMDHPLTPRAMRETLLDVLDYCNTDFRPYYREVADQIRAMARERGLTTIVELGAGLAPLTKALAQDNMDSFSLIPCDLFPEPGAWQGLERRYGKVVQPMYHSVDFTVQHEWPAGTALVLCAALHHIPQAFRPGTLMTLHDSADCVLIFEPVRKTPFSMFLVLFAVLPALLTPAFRMSRRGWFRRVFFCWLVPVVPLMFVWDALVSCVRQWSPTEWTRFSRSLPTGTRSPRVIATPHSQTIVW